MKKKITYTLISALIMCFGLFLVFAAISYALKIFEPHIILDHWVNLMIYPAAFCGVVRWAFSCFSSAIDLILSAFKPKGEEEDEEDWEGI